jgi:siroheme decarboxylase
MIDPVDREILLFVQEDLPLDPHPYAKLSERLTISENEICSRLVRFHETGLIRRFGAILRHEKAGFKANAMVVWRVDEGDLDKAGSILATSISVSHLYSRPTFDNWPFNLYSMIHARDNDDLENIINNLATMVGSLSHEYRILKSIREYKKTSMNYFTEDSR